VRSKRAPGVSYAAEGALYELFIVVRSTPSGTTVSLTWTERSKGDQPSQGRRWSRREESPKPLHTLLHATNLAAWVARRALAADWVQERPAPKK
jgi:hypothetical protein